MVTARVSSPVVIAERLSSQHRFPHVSGLREFVIKLAVRVSVFVICPQPQGEGVTAILLSARLVVSVEITSRVAGGWGTALLLLARPIISIDVTSRVAGLGDRSIAAGVGNGSNERHQPDWVSGGTSA